MLFVDLELEAVLLFVDLPVLEAKLAAISFAIGTRGEGTSHGFTVLEANPADLPRIRAWWSKNGALRFTRSKWKRVAVTA